MDAGKLESVPQLIERFLRDSSTQFAHPTVAAYSQAMHLFIQHLRQSYKINPQAIGATDLQMEWGKTFVDWLQSSRSVETEHLYSRALLHFYEFVEHSLGREIGADAFAAYLDGHRRIKSHEIPAVNLAAVEAVIRCAEASQPVSGMGTEREYLGQLRDRAFLLTLAHAGLRISEICDLRRDHLDSPHSCLRIDNQIALPLPSAAAGAINSYLNARWELDRRQTITSGDRLPLFARHDKRAAARILPISRWTGANIVEAWVRTALAPAERSQLEASGQVITPHTFRHYFVINALRHTDRDITATQLLARHGDRSTTRRYLAKIEKNPETSQS